MPSQYKFALGTVRFCCPHCDQAYFGTDANGLLTPVSFQCQSCSRAIHMDEMTLLPAEGLEEEQTKVGCVPWLEREQLGTFKALYKTIWMALVSPTQLSRMTPDHGKQGKAWGFALVITVLVVVFGVGPVFAFSTGLGLLMGGRIGGWAFAGVMFLTSVISLIMTIVATMIYILIWGGVTQLLLGRTARRLSQTYQSLCYSAGANSATIVPCLGMYFGWIWWLVSAILMVRETHKVSGGRATFAVLAFPVTSILLFVGGYAVFISYMISTTGATFAAASTGPNAQTLEVVQAVSSYASEHGSYPDHAIELVAGYHLIGDDLKPSQPVKTLRTVPLAGTNLLQFNHISETRQKKIVQSMIDAMPEGTIAHRLGDFVFTYHGIDANGADPALWLAIRSQDPDLNRKRSSPRIIAVGCADWTVHAIPVGKFSQQLSKQNALRAKYGLSPLPHPKTVTHLKPAVAAPKESTAGS